MLSEAQIEETRDWIERAVITSMMKSWQNCAEIRSEISDRHFRSSQYKVIFERVIDCAQESENGNAASQPEFMMLREKLEGGKSKHNFSDENDMEFVGGIPAIMTIWQNKIEQGDTLRYVSRLQSYVFNQEFDDAIRRVQEARVEGIRAEELVGELDKIGDLQMEIGEDPVHKVGFTSNVRDDMEGIPTVFTRVNERLETRGFALGQTSVIRAFTGGYKTTTMLQCFELTGRTEPTVFVSVADMNTARIEQKIMKQITGFKYPPNERGFEAVHEWENTKIALRERKMFILDAIQSRTEKYQFIENLIPRLERLRLEAGIKSVFIDYFQRLDTTQKITNPVEKQKYIARKIESYAEKSGMAIIIGSQITIKDGTVMTKGGRDIEENSSLTWSLKMVEEPKESRDAMLEVVKARFGASGWKFTCRFNEQYQRLEQT